MAYRLYDGNILPFDAGNPYNVKWDISAKDGFIIITEGQYLSAFRQGELSGEYKLGAYCHTATKIYGIYLVAEQTIWNTGAHQLGVFVQASMAPNEPIQNFAHISGGLCFNGVLVPCSSRKPKWEMDDSMGLGLTTELFKNFPGYKDYMHETAIEWYYRYEFLGKHLYVQPDVQFVFLPTHMRIKHDYSLFLALRVGAVL